MGNCSSNPCISRRIAQQVVTGNTASDQPTTAATPQPLSPGVVQLPVRHSAENRGRQAASAGVSRSPSPANQLPAAPANSRDSAASPAAPVLATRPLMQRAESIFRRNMVVGSTGMRNVGTISYLPQ